MIRLLFFLVGWSWLLSRKSLVRASKQLKEICGQCSLLSSSDVPCILSACLISLEADSTLRIMPDQFTPDERFSQASVNCNLSTPHDVTCTHILVFPTSATTQVCIRTNFWKSYFTACRWDSRVDFSERVGKNRTTLLFTIFKKKITVKSPKILRKLYDALEKVKKNFKISGNLEIFLQNFVEMLEILRFS